MTFLSAVKKHMNGFAVFLLIIVICLIANLHERDKNIGILRNTIIECYTTINKANDKIAYFDGPIGRIRDYKRLGVGYDGIGEYVDRLQGMDSIDNPCYIPY